MMPNPQTFFLTGVTGTLGKEILKSLLNTTDHRLILLIRGKRGTSHWDRARKILAAFDREACLGTRVDVVAGDVTLPKLGLKPEEYERIQASADQIFHIAALTALNGSQEDCFRINLGGTQEMLQLAGGAHAQGRLNRFFYFSTAYVAGSLQTYHAPEDGLPEKPAHANHYEASKYAAETQVRAAMQAGLPVTIFRPSIVVGDSKTGEVSEFNVIYPFMKLFAHGILKQLPTRLDNSFNIVPIDFVVQGSMAIAACEDSVDKTFHLVSPNPPSMATIVKLKEEVFPQFPAFQIVDPESFGKEDLPESEKFIYEMMRPYLGYLNGGLTFETKNAETFLARAGVAWPETGYEFMRTLVNYAIEVGYLVH